VHSKHICVCSHAGLKVSHCSKWIIVPSWLSCIVAIGVILKRVICSLTGPVDLTMVYSGVSSSVVLHVERSIPTSLLLPVERTIPNSVLLFQCWIKCNCPLLRAQNLHFGLFRLCCTWCDCCWCRRGCRWVCITFWWCNRCWWVMRTAFVRAYIVFFCLWSRGVKRTAFVWAYIVWWSVGLNAGENVFWIPSATSFPNVLSLSPWRKASPTSL
jgi:hypothetical protein